MRVVFQATLGALVLVEANGNRLHTSSFPPFDVFLQQYGLSYGEEYATRKALYEQRRMEAEQQIHATDKLWTPGVNKRWAWTDDELRVSKAGPVADQALISSQQRSQKRLRAARVAELQEVGNVSKTDASMAPPLPESHSWSNLSTWTETVVDQGSCGSCWAMAAATLLQAHTEIHLSEARTFSVQEMVSCVPNPNECGGTGGCGGATMGLALEWVWQHGSSLEKDAPYTSGDDGDNGSCNRDRLLQGGTQAALSANAGQSFGMKGWNKLPSNRYAPLMQALVQQGPVGVSVAADSWHLYGSGIFDRCGKDAVINHAVILVAYGQEQGHKYWTLRNSWGLDWGENGMLRLLRRDDDETNWCGTDHDPGMGTGCKGGPPTVTVCGMCGMLYSSVLPLF
mmetsp:Transcript_64860/g.154863  ORF Transcript_64860/g.154863 Transcript_64860/m.154863 type:complete len:397 (-) Transcript_64860:50-1240(-)